MVVSGAVLLLSITVLRPVYGQPSALALDSSLVRPLSEVPENISRKVMTRQPVIAHFKKGGFELYYIAAEHGNSSGNKTLPLISRVFEKFQVQAAIIEGRSYDSGEVPRRSAEELRKKEENSSYRWGEGEYTTKLAHRRGIPIFGGEPSDKDKFQGVSEKGYELTDYLALIFLSLAGYQDSVGTWAAAKAPDVLSDVMSWERNQLGFGAEVSFEYPDFLKWYRAKNGKEFDPRKIGGHAMPEADGVLFEQRIGHEVDMVRNRFILGVIDRSLNKYKRVLVVFGNGHLATQWDALVAAFGEPIYLGTLRSKKANIKTNSGAGTKIKGKPNHGEN